MNEKRYAVLDRDGTIIEERHYLSDPDQVELIGTAVEGLKALHELGLGLIVLTNQSAIGRGIIDAERLAQIHRRLVSLLEAEGVALDGIFHCPHQPSDQCECRKPLPGMLLRAAETLRFDPRRAFVFGDKPCDIEMGRRVQAVTFLVRTGYGADFEARGEVHSDYVVDTLNDAVPIIKRLLEEDEAQPHGDIKNGTFC